MDMNAMDSTAGRYEDIRNLARPEDRPLCDALHALVLSIHRTPHILVWPKQKIISYGVGPKKMSQHYAYIGVQSSHINFGFYYGTSLNDQSGIVEGTGKNLRHVKIRNISQIKSKELLELLKNAKHDRIPYADKSRPDDK
jgi:hypothetical protein